MADEDKLLDHNFDGIQEYDNPLPKWWLWLFYGTIIFSIGYMPYYHGFGGPSSTEEYQAEVAAAEAFQKANAPAPVVAGSRNGGDSSAPGAQAAAASDVGAGESIYKANCVACHGQLGEGGIGPNLTDEYWLHGNSQEDLLKVVRDGVIEKGMVAWKSVLSPSKINNVVAYLQTLEGTNPANGKAPQGEKL